MTARAFLASFLIAGLMIAPTVSAAPVAEARGNEFLTRYVRVGSTVELDGTHSYGDDCTLTYSWTMVSRPTGSAAAISAPGNAQPTFVPDRVGDYVIDLVVGDSSGTSDPARITVSAITGGPYPLPAKNADKWMTLTPKIMDRTLPQISLPATHDSGAYWLDRSRRGPDYNDKGFRTSWWQDVALWFGGTDEYEIKNEVAYDVTLAQDHDLLGQLNGGVRAFDLRVTQRDGVFYVYHGLLGKPLTVLLQDVRTFMAQVGKELVVVDVSHLNVGTDENSDSRPFSASEHRLLMQLLVDELGPYLFPRNDRSTAELLAMPLGQIVAQGSRILLLYEGASTIDDPNAKLFWPGGLWTSPGGFTNTTRVFDSQPVSCPRGDETGKGGQFPDQQCSALLYSVGGSAAGFALHQTLTADEGIATNAAKCRAGQHLPWLPPALGAAKLILEGSCDETRTLRELSRKVNPYLPSMLGAIAPVQPGLIRVDFYEESAVVSEAIRLNQRDSTAPTSSAARTPPANRYGTGFADVTVTLSGTDEPGGAGVAGIYFETTGAQSSSGESCGARTELLIKAKGLTTLKYAAWDREGNVGPEQFLQVRIDQKCDFNRDGKADAADRTGLLWSLYDKSSQFLGDLDEDGRYTSQEWIRCWYHLYKGSPL